MANTEPRNDALTISFEGKSYHTGYSRIQKYVQCPRQYRFAYVDKIKAPSGTPAQRGTAYHNTLDVALKFKISKGRSLSLGKCVELARFHAEQEGLTESVVNQVVGAVQFWYESLYHKIDPLFVEETFSIVRNGVTLTGRCDLGCVDGVCVDHKLAAAAWPAAKAKQSVQAIIYQWAWEDVFAQKYGVPYKRFEYHVLRTFPGMSGQVLKVRRLTEKGSTWYEQQIREVAEGMCKGVYYARPDVAACGWCPYRKECAPVLYTVQESSFGAVDEDMN